MAKSMHEIIVDEMYMFMNETMNKENYYKYELVHPYTATYWRFKSRSDTEHRIRMFPKVDKVTHKRYYEIKFGMYDSKLDAIIFDEPPENDDKVFNTHVKIAVDEIIKKHTEINEYRLPVVDEDLRRVRLYRIAINMYLDKNEWSVSIDNKNTLILKRNMK